MERGVRAAAVAAGAGIVALASLECGRPVRVGAVPADATGYARDVAPILREHCASCHGPEKQESDLRLDSRAEVLKGGMSGPVVVAGRSGESLLVRHLDGRASPRMPHRKPPLAPDEIARLAAWIDAGARGGDDEPAVLAAKPATHWAYVKPRRPPVPTVRDTSRVRNPIDAFVVARLEKEGLAPSPEASRETLVRRLSAVDVSCLGDDRERLT